VVVSAWGGDSSERPIGGKAGCKERDEALTVQGKYDFMKSAVTLILGEFKKRNLPMHEDLGRALVSTNT
jgi:hypothetical protein